MPEFTNQSGQKFTAQLVNKDLLEVTYEDTIQGKIYLVVSRDRRSVFSWGVLGEDGEGIVASGDSSVLLDALSKLTAALMRESSIRQDLRRKEEDGRNAFKRFIIGCESPSFSLSAPNPRQPG